jgi:ankyrin repeat protein
MGADPDLVDNNGQTPLYYAIKQGKFEVCEFLLKAGAKLTVADKKGQSPVQWAKRFNKQQIVDLLVQFGAAPPEGAKSQKNKAQKMPPPVKQKVNERKLPRPYVLTVLKNGVYEPLSEQEFQQFR